MFNFDIGLQIWTVLTFGGLVLLLAKFAFKPLKKILDEREIFIRKSVDDAKHAQAEAAKLIAENNVRMSEARADALKLMEEGRAAAERQLRDAEKQGREDARAMLSRAQEEIGREVERGVERLKSTVVDLSVEVASKVIKDKLDRKQHEAIVDEMINRLKNTDGQPLNTN